MQENCALAPRRYATGSEYRSLDQRVERGE